MTKRNPIARSLRDSSLRQRVVPGRKAVPTLGGQVICRTCGDRYAPYGDGWDGECPTCADITFEKEQASER